MLVACFFFFFFSTVSTIKTVHACFFHSLTHNTCSVQDPVCKWDTARVLCALWRSQKSEHHRRERGGYVGRRSNRWKHTEANRVSTPTRNMTSPKGLVHIYLSIFCIIWPFPSPYPLPPRSRLRDKPPSTSSLSRAARYLYLSRGRRNAERGDNRGFALRGKTRREAKARERTARGKKCNEAKKGRHWEKKRQNQRWSVEKGREEREGEWWLVDQRGREIRTCSETEKRGWGGKESGERQHYRNKRKRETDRLTESWPGNHR